MESQDTNTYPMGTQTWVLGADLSMCNLKKGAYVNLTLSKCYPDKFTCNSGHCIPLR